MKPYSLEGTSKTPAVHLDPGTGILEISGRSIPESAIDFYRPILEWLDGYGEEPCEKTELRVRFEYLNTSSSKCFYDVLRKLKALADKGMKLEVSWFYEEDDEDMLEAGEDFQDVIGMPFNFVETEEG